MPSLKTGNDPRFAAFSAGSSIMEDSFIRYFASGARLIDMMRGSFLHKSHWRAEPEPLAKVLLVRSGFYPWVLYVACFYLGMYEGFWVLDILLKRGIRKLGIAWSRSELTRMAQVLGHADQPTSSHRGASVHEADAA